MLLKRFFGGKAAESEPFLPTTSSASTDASPQLALLIRQCYAQFLSDYVAHGFSEALGEQEVQIHFSTFERLMGLQQIEQQRQKANRNYHEIIQLAESVLVDQRNYMLAHHINTTATAMGFHGDGAPFSGMETENGQPCHAFACKLLADSSLGRGAANGLSEDAITLLEHHIARRAEAETSHFLNLYQQEHAL